MSADLDLSHRTRASTVLAALALVLGGASLASAQDDAGPAVVVARDRLIGGKGCGGGRNRARVDRALGVDREGRAVMVHVRTSHSMHALLRMLAGRAIGLQGSVVVDAAAAGEGVASMGTWEDGFHEGDDLHEMWDLPDVVGVERR